MPDRRAIPDDEVRYIYRKMGHLEAQVEQTQRGSDEIKAHSVETRGMLQEHIQEVRQSNAVNDARWATVERQLEIVTAVQEMHKVFRTVGKFLTGTIGLLKSLAIITGVAGIVYFALKSGDFSSALNALKLLVGTST